MDWTPVALCVALGLGVIVQFVLPWNDPLPPASPLASRRPRPVTIPAPGQYPVILGAPIFSPDRKPGEDTGSAPGANALDAYTALGVATGRGLATALIKGPGAGPQLIRLGQELEGWKLVGLDRQKLTFERNGARHVLAIGAAATPANGAAQSDSDE
jgi:hypothetical protein